MYLNDGHGGSVASWGSLEAEPVSKADTPSGSFLIHWPKENAKCQLTRRQKQKGSVTRWFPQGRSRESSRKEETCWQFPNEQAGIPGSIAQSKQRLTVFGFVLKRSPHSSRWTGKTHWREDPLRCISEPLCSRNTSPDLSLPTSWIIFQTQEITFSF